MDWRRFSTEILGRVPNNPDLFNKMVKEFKEAAISDSGNTDGATNLFQFECNQLTIKPGNAFIDPEEKWFKLFFIVAKQTQHLQHQNCLNELNNKLKEVAGNLIQQSRVSVTVDDRTIKKMIHSIESYSDTAYKQWQAKQHIMYELLYLNEQAKKHKNPRVKGYTKKLLICFRIAMETDFSETIPMHNSPSKTPKRVGTAKPLPFYSELANLMIETQCKGLFKSLFRVQSLLITHIFKKANPDHVFQCKTIEMKMRWVNALNKIWFPWGWHQYICEDDKEVRVQLKSDLLIMPVTATGWLNQVIEHCQLLKKVRHPWLSRVMHRQINEVIRDVLGNHVSKLELDNLLALLDILPNNAKTSPLVLTFITQKLPQADIDQRIKFIEILVTREKHRNTANPYVKTYLKDIYSYPMTQVQRAKLEGLIQTHNDFIKTYTSGIKGFFRRHHKKHTFNELHKDSKQFLLALRNKSKFSENAVTKRLAPFSEATSDKDYQQQMNDLFIQPSETLSTVEVKKNDQFNQLVTLCSGRGKKQSLQRDVQQGRMKASSLSVLSTPMTKETSLKLPNSGAVLQQTVSDLKVVLNNPNSMLTQNFSNDDLIKLKKMIQHFDDLETTEAQKIAIHQNPAHSEFYSVLQRRLGAMLLTASVISSGDVAVQAAKGGRYTGKLARIGGAVISVPVISGVVSALGDAIEASDATRIETNYVDLKDLTPTATTEQAFAEMIARMVTIRYSTQISQLSQDSIKQFATYCFLKMKGGLITGKHFNVPSKLNFSAESFADEYAIKNSSAFRKAYAVTQILNHPADLDTIAKDHLVQLKLYNRIRLGKNSKLITKEWDCEQLLTEADKTYHGVTYRSEYAPSDRVGASPYGATLVMNADEVDGLIPIDAPEQPAIESSVPGKPSNMTQLLLNLEAKQAFLENRFDAFRSTNQQTPSHRKRQNQHTYQTPHQVKPSLIHGAKTLCPDFFKAAVNAIVIDTPSSQFPTINTKLDKVQSDFEMPNNPAIPAAYTTPNIRLHRRSSPMKRGNRASVTPNTMNWQSEQALIDTIVDLTKAYKELGPSEEQKKATLREKLYGKMYEYCVQKKELYTVDEAIVIFNQWCGFDCETLTPQKLLRQNLREPDKKANQGADSPVRATSQSPFAIPASPAVMRY